MGWPEFWAGLAVGLGFLMYLEQRRRSRILNQMGYYLVELCNVLEATQAQQDGRDANWSAWKDM